MPPNGTEIVAVKKKGQSRFTRFRPKPPTTACQTLVTNDGISKSAIALVRSMAMVRIARLTVGSPRPITPLTVPASRNTKIIIDSVEISIRLCFFSKRTSNLQKHA
jgi:hypothetical protein